MTRTASLTAALSRRVRGFTLVELMIVVAIIGVLSAVAIPSFMKYIRRSKTTEASMNLRKMYDSSVTYYEAEHADSAGSIVTKQFPSAKTWTPTQGQCCLETGRKCTPPNHINDWTHAVWQALNFSIDDPFYYSYQTVATVGTGSAIGDRYDLEGSGDLNCNGTYSLFRRSANVDSNYGIRGGSGLYILNELE